MELIGECWQHLAALGVRETGFRNIREIDPAGSGQGVYQISHNQVPAEVAYDLAKASDWVAAKVAENMGRFAVINNDNNRNPYLAAAREYNAGGGYTLSKLLAPDYLDQLDRGTTFNNYVSSAINLMDCFE